MPNTSATPTRRRPWLYLIGAILLVILIATPIILTNGVNRPETTEFKLKFATAGYVQPEHYQNCAPRNWRRLLHYRKLWQACATHTLYVRWSDNDLQEVKSNQSDRRIDSFPRQSVRSGSDWSEMVFQFNALVPFGVFMRVNNDNWHFINSPATQIVFATSAKVEFFAMATDPAAQSSPRIDYPQGFVPETLQAANEWPNNDDCLRSGAVSFENGERLQMGGSTTTRQYQVNHSVKGHNMTLTFDYGPYQPFGTWLVIETQDANGQWHVVSGYKVSNSVTVPTMGHYSLITLFDSPIACPGVALPRGITLE